MDPDACSVEEGMLTDNREAAAGEDGARLSRRSGREDGEGLHVMTGEAAGGDCARARRQPCGRGGAVAAGGGLVAEGQGRRAVMRKLLRSFVIASSVPPGRGLLNLKDDNFFCDHKVRYLSARRGSFCPRHIVAANNSALLRGVC